MPRRIVFKLYLLFSWTRATVATVFDGRRLTDATGDKCLDRYVAFLERRRALVSRNGRRQDDGHAETTYCRRATSFGLAAVIFYAIVSQITLRGCCRRKESIQLGVLFVCRRRRINFSACRNQSEPRVATSASCVLVAIESQCLQLNPFSSRHLPDR